jgi:hypothetical protein
MEVDLIFRQLVALLSDMPDLRSLTETMGTPDETLQWLAKAQALTNAMPFPNNGPELNIAVSMLISSKGAEQYAARIKVTLLKTLEEARLQVPAATSGAFITAGNEFDAIAALTKVFASATTDILVVDPYMDESVFSDFAVLALEGVNINLLTDAKSAKPGLEPSRDRWIKQYASQRPLELRFAPDRTLHDRVIIVDGNAAWILTQSLKDFAKRSPATVQRADGELAALKVEAYRTIWNTSAASR